MNDEKKEFNDAVLSAISEINKKTKGELTFNMYNVPHTTFLGKNLSRTTVIEIKITENL